MKVKYQTITFTKSSGQAAGQFTQEISTLDSNYKNIESVAFIERTGKTGGVDYLIGLNQNGEEVHSPVNRRYMVYSTYVSRQDNHIFLGLINSAGNLTLKIELLATITEDLTLDCVFKLTNE